MRASYQSDEFLLHDQSLLEITRELVKWVVTLPLPEKACEINLMGGSFRLLVSENSFHSFIHIRESKVRLSL